VDFRLPGHLVREPALRTAPVVSKRKPLPSLDQITARLGSHVAGPGREASRQSARLPGFLKFAKQPIPHQAAPRVEVVNAPAPKARPTLPTPVGRLHFPVRSLQPTEPPKLAIREPKPCLPPASPTLSPPSKLQVTTTVVPRTSAVSPVELTESNLTALNSTSESREDTARKMLTRLRRRTLPPSAAMSDVGGVSTVGVEQERKLRRRSAPPELQGMERSGFSHPVLALPGGF